MLTDWVMIVITFVYVVATILICYFNHQSAKVAREQLDEMRKQYQEENRPNIGVEFIYERRLWYYIRFVNHGKKTAQHVNIQLSQEFIDSLPQAEICTMLSKQKDKECIIGVGQHYDLYIGSNDFRRNPNMTPVTGVISYQSDGKKYSSDIYIDFKNYTAFFSNNNEHDDLMKILKDGVKELNKIATSMKK